MFAANVERELEPVHMCCSTHTTHAALSHYKACMLQLLLSEQCLAIFRGEGMGSNFEAKQPCSHCTTTTPIEAITNSSQAGQKSG